MTITGTGFVGTTQVHFGKATAVFAVVSNTVITATAPAGRGTVDVTVTSPGGTSSKVTGAQFTYKK